MKRATAAMGASVALHAAALCAFAPHVSTAVESVSRPIVIPKATTQELFFVDVAPSGQGGGVAVAVVDPRSAAAAPPTQESETRAAHGERTAQPTKATSGSPTVAAVPTTPPATSPGTTQVARAHPATSAPTTQPASAVAAQAPAPANVLGSEPVPAMAHADATTTGATTTEPAVTAADTRSAVAPSMGGATDAAVQGSAIARGAGSGSGGGVAPNGSGSGSGHAGGGAIDLAAMHARLEAAARGCYPATAKKFRITGSVPVHFCVDESGAPNAIELRGSSGSDLLDRAARDCVVRGAAPLPATGSCFDLPIAFR